MSTENKKVMVIGGGIAGLTAAWELSRSGIEVELVEKAGFLGGHAIQYACKAGDECRQCGACSVEMMLKNVVDEPKIKIHLTTEMDRVKKNGRYSVRLKKSDFELHTTFNSTEAEKLAKNGYSKNNLELDRAKSGTTGTVDVDAVILASGFSIFNPEQKPTYNYGKYMNVVTSLDLERIKRAHGKVVRPSDGKVPSSIAFIQCVGSRDERLGHLWCSHYCCSYALRTADALKFKNPELDVTIFYMDIQNAGKDFPLFYEKCKSELNFVRTIPVDMYLTENNGIRTRYMDESKGVPIDGEFDLLVLSVGIMPGIDNAGLADVLGIALDTDGFFSGKEKLDPTITSKEGIFVAGTVQGPKNIHASMAHAGQAACEAMKYIGGPNG